MKQRVYFDHAATSWPKLPGVVEAFVEYQQIHGSGAGRGSYRTADYANRIIQNARGKIASLLGVNATDGIAFTHNGTSALNLAISGLIGPNEHVITTAIEHNSVLRPLMLLRDRIGVDVSVADCDLVGKVDPEAILRLIRPNTRWIVISHSSNVTGYVQDIRTISEIAHRAGAYVLLDAAQSFGYLPVDIPTLNVDAVAASGHKGAGGLLGTGFLYLCPELAELIRVPWTGGTGQHSNRIDGPIPFQEMAEAGNLNVPAIAAWNVALSHINTLQTQGDKELNRRLIRLQSLLRDFPTTRPIMITSPSTAPVVSLICESPNPSEMATILDSEFGIEVRSGLHCAGKIHEYLKTESSGGTLRFSIGHTTTDEDLDCLAEAIASLRQSDLS